jgi:hypothetical protein
MTHDIKKKHNRITQGLNAHTFTCTYTSIDMDVFVLFILLSLYIDPKYP